MTTYHGNDGLVHIGANAIAERTSFSITEEAPVDDDSAQGDAAATHLQGRPISWSGEISGHFFPGDTNGQALLVAGAAIAVTLYPIGNTSGLQSLSGNATVTSLRINSDMNNPVDFTAQIQGNGALTRGAVV